MGLIFENTINEVIVYFVAIFAIAYIYVQYLFTYWKRRGVKYSPPSFPFGNFGPSFMQKEHMGEVAKKLYNSINEPFFGVFGAVIPQILLKDPELIRLVMMKDYQYFTSRGVYSDEKEDPLSYHLFSMQSDKWKTTRTKLTPAFTSGKLKAMLRTILDCADVLENYVDRAEKNKEVIELRDLLSRYTTDVIASTSFGIDNNCIDDPNNSFRYYGKKATELSILNGIRLVAFSIFPYLHKVLHFKSVDDEVEKFMINLVSQTIKHREINNLSRKDILQLLIQLRNTGEIEKDGQWDTSIAKGEQNKQISVEEMAAQCFLFYVAGFETSSNTMTFFIFELMKNKIILNKLQNEIDEVLGKHNNEITYESLNDMKYLEACIDETLRKYPPVTILNRECTMKYTIPGTNVTIEKGTPILIPTLALHHDPKYYPEPLTYNPDRFYQQSKAEKSFTEMPYLPFGDGPRVCIGLRMAMLQMKIGMVKLLRKYNYSLISNAKDVIEYSPKGFLLTPSHNIDVLVSRRN